MKPSSYAILALLLFAVGCGNEGMTSLSSGLDSNPKPASSGSDPAGRGYFPIEVGMTWTYGEGDRVVRITETVETLFGWGYLVRGPLQDRVVSSQEDGRVLELRSREGRQLYDFGAEEGASWTIDSTGNPSDLLDGTTVRVVSRSETVEVPYGSFEGSIHLSLHPRPGLADAGITDMWFARGVGLVKWSEVWIGGVRDYELTGLEILRTAE